MGKEMINRIIIQLKMSFTDSASLSPVILKGSLQLLATSVPAIAKIPPG
jgi:hypothetical protein